MSRFMQRHAEQVCARADPPALGGVEVHVAGERLRIRRRGIERVRQHAAQAVESISVAVAARRERNGDGPLRRRARGHVVDLDVLRPHSQCLQDHALHLGGRQPVGERSKGVTQRGRSDRGAVPAAHSAGVLPDDSIAGQRARTGKHVCSRLQVLGCGKDVSHLVHAGEANGAPHVAIDQHVPRQQIAVVVRLHVGVAQDGIGVRLPHVGMKLNHEPGGVRAQFGADLVLDPQRTGRGNIQVVESRRRIGGDDQAGFRDDSHHPGAAFLDRRHVLGARRRPEIQQQVRPSVWPPDDRLHPPHVSGFQAKARFGPRDRRAEENQKEGRKPTGVHNLSYRALVALF